MPETQQAGMISLTPDQLQEMMKATVIAAVQELKRPDPEEAERIAEEKAKAARNLEDMRKTVEAEREGKRLAQSACSHTKENGRPAIGGQINSDGLVHPVCLRCHKEFDPYPPGKENVARGLGVA